MKRRPFILTTSAALATCSHLKAKTVEPTFKVTLPEAHKGTLEIDTKLLDSYGKLPENVRQFYFETRAVFAGNRSADFFSPEIIRAAQRHGIPLMGGPMLGRLAEDGVTFWLRPSTADDITITAGSQSVKVAAPIPGSTHRIPIKGLAANALYPYEVRIAAGVVAQGQFRTAPKVDSAEPFRLAFGSCCHKIGVHNPNLFAQILDRQPHAMMMLGDIAVDDRNDEINMHRADYQLRDVSAPWRNLVANVPIYASWDDHDYFDNDLSGIPKRYTAKDRDGVRRVYAENWNNPAVGSKQEGIYFNTRIGPVEIIMLDTRSCRDGKRRHEYGSYLGEAQLKWLKQVLSRSDAPFKVISSGTMWSDYVSKAKDSWGSWDKQAREELFELIEKNRIGGVLLVSGDRHGARGFRIPRPSGFNFYEFEPATLGGVSGPEGLVKNCPEQLFGYGGRDSQGNDFIAVGEFTFDTDRSDPQVTFRLIHQTGEILEEIDLSLQQLTPNA